MYHRLSFALARVDALIYRRPQNEIGKWGPVDRRSGAKVD